MMKSGPHLPQLEKALAQKRRPNIAINQSIKSLKKTKQNYGMEIIKRSVVARGSRERR